MSADSVGGREEGGGGGGQRRPCMDGSWSSSSPGCGEM